jgi:hypothetical protein
MVEASLLHVEGTRGNVEVSTLGGGRAMWKLVYCKRKGNMEVSLLLEEEGMNMEVSLLLEEEG